MWRSGLTGSYSRQKPNSPAAILRLGHGYLAPARGFGPAPQLNHQLTNPAHPRHDLQAVMFALIMTFWWVTVS